jgi:predicted nucleotidyltransferase
MDHYAENYFNLKFALEDTLKRKIDLLEEKAIKNPYFKKSIENQCQLLYGA